ncbi:hypothetical protein MCEGE14_02472 [Burkholderiaceae bacterium]
MKQLLMFFLLSISSAAFGQSPIPSNPNLEQILSTYNANQARFHTTYRGRQFNAEGVVESIETDMFGTGSKFSIKLNVERRKVLCITTNKNAAASLDKGERIRFAGVIDDVTAETLEIEDCLYAVIKASTNNSNRTAPITVNEPTVPTSPDNSAILNRAKNSYLKSLETQISKDVLANISKLENFPYFFTYSSQGDLNDDGVNDYLFFDESQTGEATGIGIVMSTTTDASRFSQQYEYHFLKDGRGEPKIVTMNLSAKIKKNLISQSGKFFIFNGKNFIEVIFADSQTTARTAISQTSSTQISDELSKLNGKWFSQIANYGYLLTNGVGVATHTNSSKFNIGDKIIELTSTGNNSFQGQQIYQNGKFYSVRMKLISQNRLLVQGEGNVSWYMDRETGNPIDPDLPLTPPPWDHNGSKMSVTIINDVLNIHYIEPRKAMMDAGARMNTLLLNGKVTGDIVTGTARIFAQKCGILTYSVTGSITSDHQQILVVGMAPVVNRQTCEVTKMIPDPLLFNIVD